MAAKAAVVKQRLLAIGDEHTGKVRLLLSFWRGQFVDSLNPVWPGNCTVDMEVDGVCIELDLCYRSNNISEDMVRLSYNKLDMVLVCFSVDKPESLQSIESYWVPEIKRLCPGVPYLVVATKADLREDRDGQYNLVSPEQGRVMAESVGACGYCECSALKDAGMKELFERACRATLQQGTRRSKLRAAVVHQVGKLKAALHIGKT